jgi:hypothetical protein
VIAFEIKNELLHSRPLLKIVSLVIKKFPNGFTKISFSRVDKAYFSLSRIDKTNPFPPALTKYTKTVFKTVF